MERRRVIANLGLCSFAVVTAVVFSGAWGFVGLLAALAIDLIAGVAVGIGLARSIGADSDDDTH